MRVREPMSLMLGVWSGDTRAVTLGHCSAVWPPGPPPPWTLLCDRPNC